MGPIFHWPEASHMAKPKSGKMLHPPEGSGRNVNISIRKLNFGNQ